MNIRQTIVNLLTPTQNNSGGVDLARDFLHNGLPNVMSPDWQRTMMEERDKYTGYMYGAATRRAVKVAMLATYNLKTKANDATAKLAQRNNQDIRHPYLSKINEAPGFENDLFWRALQTWIDVKGVAYLYVVRGEFKGVVSDIERIELLWPNEITVVRDNSDMSVIGYRQTVGGVMRDIPPHMVIMIRSFNPFSRFETFSLAEAAGDSQFSIKEISQSVRSGIRRNRRYPGVAYLTGQDVALNPEAVANFKGNLRGKSRNDEPMFAKSKSADGKGGISWNDMQIDMRKSALDLSNEISRDELLAATGVSKTILNIEQSGVTRDSSQTQQDLLVEYQAMPGLQMIIDALNEDYKTSYPNEYARYGYELTIDNPLRDDKEAEGKEIDNRISRFDLYDTLRGKGYDHDTASAYANGEKTLDEIGEPTEEPRQPVVPPAPADPTLDDPEEKPTPPKKAKDGAKNYLPVLNALAPSDKPTVQKQRESLELTVKNVQRRLVTASMNKVQRNAEFEGEQDIVDEADRTAAENELEQALSVFYQILIPLAAGVAMSERMKQFGKLGKFTTDEEVRDYIKVTARRATASHVDTVLGDILKAVKETEERLVQGELKKIKPKPGQSPEEVLQLARKLALDGNGRKEIARQIMETYDQKISKVRAETIARTEANRAYNRAQWEADRQFLTQNELMGKAYKKWLCRGDNPCGYCLAQSRKPATPFMEPFAKVGDTLRITETRLDGTKVARQMIVGFEDCSCGNLHVNCECAYLIEIRE